MKVTDLGTIEELTCRRNQNHQYEQCIIHHGNEKRGVSTIANVDSVHIEGGHSISKPEKLTWKRQRNKKNTVRLTDLPDKKTIEIFKEGDG